MILTNYLVKATIWYVSRTNPEENKDKEIEEETPTKKKQRSKIGFIVGRCGNILILTFMLLNQVTALVVIIGIKGLTRRDDVKKKPGYYLVGTIVNLTFIIHMFYY